MKVSVTPAVKTPASFDITGLTPEQFATIYLMLANMSGSPSTSLRQYTKSLVPEMQVVCGDDNHALSMQIGGVSTTAMALTLTSREAFDRMVAHLNK